MGQGQLRPTPYESSHPQLLPYFWAIHFTAPYGKEIFLDASGDVSVKFKIMEKSFQKVPFTL